MGEVFTKRKQHVVCTVESSVKLAPLFIVQEVGVEVTATRSFRKFWRHCQGKAVQEKPTDGGEGASRWPRPDLKNLSVHPH